MATRSSYIGEPDEEQGNTAAVPVGHTGSPAAMCVGNAVNKYLVDFEAAITSAESSGFEIIRGYSNTLLLDLDTPEDVVFFEATSKLLKGHIKFQVLDRWVSKSGKGEHVVLRLAEDLPVAVRLLLQACLGSDRRHELLSFVTGVRKGNSNPSVLFKPKGNPLI